MLDEWLGALSRLLNPAMRLLHGTEVIVRHWMTLMEVKGGDQDIVVSLGTVLIVGGLAWLADGWVRLLVLVIAAVLFLKAWGVLGY